AAPILLLLGLTHTGAGAVSLLNNFEIVATTLLALLFFREAVPGRLWVAILFILAGFLLMLVGTYFAAIPAWKERKTT
ncbi:MAG: EamA family transporter, partial [Clostridia bacterium]|nr:EamA family transporter [Clostridia bacterium]